MSSNKDTSIQDFAMGLVLFITGIISLLKNTSIGVTWSSRFWGTGLPSALIMIPLIAAIVVFILSKRWRKTAFIVFCVAAIILMVQLMFSLRIFISTMSVLKFLIMAVCTVLGVILIMKSLMR